MARSRLQCDSLCVTFLILTVLRAALSADDFYLYNTDLQSTRNTDIVLRLLEDGGHNIHKREATNQTQGLPVSSSATPPQNNITAATTNSSKLSPPQPTPTVAETSHKNLGENGTGIRKTISSTEKPLMTTLPTFKTENNNVSVARNNQTGDNDEVSISRYPDSSVDFNKTLKQHNITQQQNDTHLYYNSTFKTDPLAGQSYWVNLTNLTGVTVNELLSRSYRRAATVRLSFDFPFYGHLIRNVTIATGGFLYTGDYMHSWLAATQYIAPLMANFDTSLKNHSYIKYVDNGTAFTVQWENVTLQDKPDDGDFTFQVTLYKNGNIVFVYQNVPVVIENIQDNNHPVKVGLSDAYIIDRTIFFVRRKTIYEYHRVNFRQQDIKNWTVIYLNALPTCLDNTNCTTCLTNKVPGFQCTWCPSISKCSNGLDRHRQDWLTKNCEKLLMVNATQCLHIIHTDTVDDIDSYNHQDDFSHPIDTNVRPFTSNVPPRASPVKPPHQPDKMGFSSIIATLFLVALIIALGVWVMYAYRNPHTTSGQMLIRYRPSQWRWRRGEARYTAATIHM